MANNIVNETNTVSWYNGTGADVVSGQLLTENDICFIAAEDIASTATGTIIVPKATVAKLSLIAGDAADFGASLYKSTGAGTVTITGSSVAAFVGFNLTSVSSVAAVQSIDVAMWASKKDYAV